MLQLFQKIVVSSKLKKENPPITLYLSFNINESLNIDNTEIYFESFLLKNI